MAERRRCDGWIAITLILQLITIGLGIAISVIVWQELWLHTSWEWTFPERGYAGYYVPVPGSYPSPPDWCFLSDTTFNFCGMTFIVALIGFVVNVIIVLTQVVQCCGRKNSAASDLIFSLLAGGLYLAMAITLTVFWNKMSYGWALATQLAGRDSYATAVQVMCYVAAGVFLVQAALSVVRLCAPAPAAAAAAAGPPDLEALAAGGAPSKEEVGMRVPGWLPVSNCPMPQPYPSTFYATA